MFTLWILLIITTAYSQDMETTTSSPNITILYPTNKTITRNDTDSKLSKKPNPQTWKLEAAFVESNLTDVAADNCSETEETTGKKEALKDFKPSQHLGSFFDEDSAEQIKTPIVGPVFKKPASGFVSSVKDEYHGSTFNKIPKEIYQTHKEFPYRFEDAIYMKAKPNWHDESMDSKPTVEVPVKLPAGGLYKSPVVFKEKPNSDEELGLDINEEGKEQEHAVKKRGNPWQNLLRLVTAFIPVGLIISALTPSVITIHNIDDNRDPSNIYRRSEAGPRVPELAPISERCRRRLLCELQSDRHYTTQSSPPRRTKKHCYKIHCEDTESLWRMLRWLFTYNQPEDDQRGRHLT